MKRIVCCILSIILIFSCLTASGQAVNSDASFLIGDWSTSDGIYLSFYDDETFYLEWGSYYLVEEGRWSTGSMSNDSFTIHMDGSSILTLMSLIYGLSMSDYHFEVLKCDDNNFYLVQVYDDYTAKTSPCKLAFTRDGEQRNFSYSDDVKPTEKPADSTPDTQENNGDDLSVKEQDFAFYWGDNKSSTVSINWGWGLFDKSATEYDHDLAIAALAISQIIHNRDSFVERIENEFGFGDIVFRDYSTWDTPAYALGHRQVSFNGQEKHIVMVCLRGTNLDLDGPNDLINDLKAQRNGFRPGTEAIHSVIMKYLAALKCKKENTIMFITGHSLGGGIAQSLAPFAENYTSSDDNCFIYTFAPTNCFIDMLHYGSYDNVHNIINENDLVPHLPLYFGKYGHKWYYNSYDSKYLEYYEKIYDTKGWTADNIIKWHEHSTYLAMMLCDLPDNMGSGADHSYSITSIHCPVDIEVYDLDGNLMGRTSGDDVELTDTSRVLILTDEGNKEVVAPPGEEYYVYILGTDTGTMTVTQQKVDSETDTVLSEKEFSNVSVEKDQLFELVIRDDDPQKLALDVVEQKSFQGIAKSDNKWLLYLFIGSGVLVLISVALVIILIKKKKDRERRRKLAEKYDYNLW